MVQAKAHRARAMELEKGRFSAPKSCGITVWYSAISVHYDIQFEKHKMDLALFEADTLWHEAVSSAKGNVKCTWEEVPDRGYRCILETGEVFEP